MALRSREYSCDDEYKRNDRKVQDWQKRATKTAKNFGEATDNYVRENTWTTIALAAVIGCIFGYFMAGRRD